MAVFASGFVSLNIAWFWLIHLYTGATFSLSSPVTSSCGGQSLSGSVEPKGTSIMAPDAYVSAALILIRLL